MKTLHRAAYEVLTPDEYKEFCRLPKELLKWSLLVDWESAGKRVMIDSFIWGDAPQPTTSNLSPLAYWSEVSRRLFKVYGVHQ